MSRKHNKTQENFTHFGFLCNNENGKYKIFWENIMSSLKEISVIKGSLLRSELCIRLLLPIPPDFVL